jgi:hypothetical protein
VTARPLQHSNVREDRTMDRRELKRWYRETPRPMGVYRVLNRENGNALIAASADLTAILNRHRAQLNFGSHPDGELQRDWDRFGPEAFEFEILDTLEPKDAPDYDPADDLEVLREMWLARLSPGAEPGYQIRARTAKEEA